MRHIFAALGLLLLGGAATSAQQFVLSTQDRARLIAVDFAAVMPDGRPVTDLRADEVKLKIDGRTRPIRSLEYVPVAEPTMARSSAGPIPPPYGSNTLSETGRSIILIIDDETFRQGREAGLRDSVNRFVGLLDARDRVALVTVPYGGLKVDLTTDHRRISQAMMTVVGRAPQTETASEASCRTRTTLIALAGALESLRGGEAPAAVVFFSARMSTSKGIVPIARGQTIGTCELLIEHFQRVGEGAANSHAQFYVVQPELSADADGLIGLEHLTGVTGAPLLHLNSGTDGALARVVRETAGYYIARFEPEPSETRGSIRGLDVEASRPGLVLRRRPQMTVVRADARFVNAAAPTPLDMMREAKVYRDLPLRVTGYTSREPGGDTLKVVTMFDAVDSTTSLSSAMVGLFNDQGKLVASTSLMAAELVTTPIMVALAVPAGHYRLRVAAVESPGRAGSADYEVTAELADAGPLKLSALVMGLSRNGRFRPRLDFGNEASAMAYLEIYGGKAGTAVGVVFELAKTVNGPALVALPGAFRSTSEPDRFIVTAAVPIGAVPAGDYMIRATVAAQGQPGGRVLRSLRKTLVAK